jgi:hypothetical protein
MLNAIRIQIPMLMFDLVIYVIWIRKYCDREDNGFRDSDVFTHSEPPHPKYEKAVSVLSSVCMCVRMNVLLGSI